MRKHLLRKPGDLVLQSSPLVIVDIGASGGIDRRWAKFTSHFTAVLVEPDSRETPNLTADGRVDRILLSKALSNRAEKQKFHLCRKQQVSSLYHPNFSVLENYPEVERMRVVDTIELETDTLDNQLQTSGIPRADFIKIDVQGAELPILQGAEATLKNVIGLELEVEFVPLYEGQPLFGDVDKFVTSQGFQLFDLRRYFWSRKEVHNLSTRKKGQLIFCDALYFRTPEAILAEPEVNGERILHAAAVYLAYRYVDIAHVLFSQAQAKGLLNGEKIAQLEALLKRYRGQGIFPNVRGRARLGKYLHALGNWVAPRNWYFGTDYRVGN